MKNLILYIAILLGSISLMAQEKFSVYHPEADAKAEIASAVAKANAEGKHVFLQLGGNWCGWCKLFHDLTTTDEELKKYIAENYEVVHVNYSKENENLEVMKSLDFPQRFGFPVFVILDGSGKRIHTQNSGYLEEGKGHSQKKVMEFLQAWSPEALKAENYSKK